VEKKPPAFGLSPISVDAQKMLLSPRRNTRKIPKSPFKVLDAPQLTDDFYLNLVDWSSENVLAVGLGIAFVRKKLSEPSFLLLLETSACDDRLVKRKVVHSSNND